MSATGSSAGVLKRVTIGSAEAGVMRHSVPAPRGPTYSSSPYPYSSVWRRVRNCV